MNKSFGATGYENSLRWFARASKVIPGGIYGHTSPVTTLGGVFPYYAEKADGCRYWDIDGREYIDYMCAYGPIVLGYRHPEVEAAAEKQRKDGNAFNHPTTAIVELAERLVSLVDFAEWAVFAKNGADLTTWSIQVAREKTGRPKVLKIRGAYHGAHAWCTPGHAGLIPEDRAHVHEFTWNDLDSFEAQVKKHQGKVAAVMVTPFHHPAFGDGVLPAPGFLQSVQAICRREGIVLILDDVRAGFRLHLGGSHRYFNFEPDVAVYCKALGNGYPISAAVGRADLKVAASKVFLTGSYWNSAVPMRVALKVLEVLERDNGLAHMDRMGGLLGEGLKQLALKYGQRIKWTGPNAIPFSSFENDPAWHRQQLFCTEVTARGAFFHPHHNWFLSVAHQEKDIADTLAAAEPAMAMVQAEFGSV
jgi:glutamate-1-semialdehyde 2,1-aminomutase